MEARYCTMCGKRIERPKSTKTYEVYGTSYTVNYYVTNHTEPICPGHQVPREPVPQAFYDAFCGEQEE